MKIIRLVALSVISASLLGGCRFPGDGGNNGVTTSTTSALTAAQCDSFEVGGTTRICHATGSARNPYVLLSVSEQACVAAHSAHARDYVSVGDPTCNGQGCLPSGAPCDATLPCCSGLACRNGSCAPVDLCKNVTCAASDQCHVSSCDPATGRCLNDPKVDGFPCDDGNSCTTVDTCQTGTCTGGNPVTCTASDQCHLPGQCAPTTGMCSNPVASNGTSCGPSSSCHAGACSSNRCSPMVFTASNPYPVGDVHGGEPVTLKAVDLNGDGRLDLVTGDYDNGVHVLLGNGDGTFSDHGEFPANNFVAYMSVGDVNNDGKQDVVVMNYTQQEVSVLLGNGDGSLQPPLVTLTPEADYSAELGDANGDGKLDLAVGNVSGTLDIMLGNGDGTFQTPIAVYDLNLGDTQHGRAAGIKFADVNADGKKDILVANQWTELLVLLGNGDGTFAAPARYQTYPTGNDPQALELGDLNGDGRSDVVLACMVSGTVASLLGNADGTFSSLANAPVGAAPDALTLGDFDGDGKLDVAAANTGSANLSILTGNGDGTFSPGLTIGLGGEANGIASGDFDGDGRLDFAACSETLNSVTVFLNRCHP